MAPTGEPASASHEQRLPILPAAAQPARRWPQLVGHGLRLAAIALVVLLLRLESKTYQAEASRQAAAAIPLETIRKYLPQAQELSGWRHDLAARLVMDQNGETIGWFVQTSPQSDHVIGYSGPTNCLLVVNDQSTIVGVEILSSGDTHNHVRDVRDDPGFLNAWRGLQWDTAAQQPVDTVSGATLTSLAVIDSIRGRLGHPQPSLRFSHPPTVEQARKFFPAAAELVPTKDSGELWLVLNAAGQGVGKLLRTSPAADSVMGYQGPTDAVLALDLQQSIVGLWIGESYDNEPYVGYVRDDAYFLERFNGLPLSELAARDPSSRDVEGVSGATMTSQAVYRGLIAAAQASQTQPTTPSRSWQWSLRDTGTVAVLLGGLLFCFTSLRGNRWARSGFQLLLIGYFGLLNGDLLSIALLTGWAQVGIGWQIAPGLSLLGAAALLTPVLTKRQLYCHHLCPFGAAQHLIKNRVPWKVRLGRRLTTSLQLLPAVLLGLTLCIALRHWPINLASLEPFDAFVFWVAGPVSLGIALLGLLAALFVPMAYCRFGCPTGAVLSYLRRQGHAGRWRRADGAALALILLALVLRYL